MFYTLLFVEIICCFGAVVVATNWEELLLQDPSLWPGHLEPFGSQQPIAEIEVRSSWPDPTSFFAEYVDKNKPVLFKGLAKQSPAYALFDDEYLMMFDGADTTKIYAEPEKKENRTKEGYMMSFKEFIQRYHNESLYLVHELPKQLSQHVRMPAPLRCEDSRKLMKMQVTWFSNGGTKSVLHNDNIDNVNCLFRGTKRFWMIEYTKNKQYIPLDHPEGAYSSLDVEKVNYTKYPELRKVDKYYYVDMQEGDCMFIPYLWVHQVNSVANEKGQNLAVNIWFDHVLNHRPKKCEISESEATIDKYEFEIDNKVTKELKKEIEEKDKEGGDDGKEKEPQSQEEEQAMPDELRIVHRFISRVKSHSLAMKDFLVILKKHKHFNNLKLKFQGVPDEFRSIGEKMFKVIDVNEDGNLTEEDIMQIQSLEDPEYETLVSLLERHTGYAHIYFRDLNDEQEKEKLLKASSITSQEETGKGKEEL